MKTFFKKIYILFVVLPLLGAINYKDNGPGGCVGLPDFEGTGTTTTNGKGVFTTKNINIIETDTQIAVYGEVKNIGSKAARNITFTANLLDSSGQTINSVGPDPIIGVSRRLTSAPDTIDYSTLNPNEKGYFSITVDKTSKQINVATVQTTFTGTEDTGLEGLNANMSTKITKTTKDSDNNLTISGFLINNSTSTDTWNNKIAVIIENKAGQIVFIGEETLGDTLTVGNTQRDNAIVAGDRKSFIFTTEVLYDTVDISNIKTNINWEEEGPTVPNAPKNLKLSLESANEVTLTFTDNSSDENRFKIFRKVKGEKKFTRIKILKAVSGSNNTLTYTDKNLLLGKTYTYKVLAHNETGNSESSNKEKIKISGPDSPENLKAAIKYSDDKTNVWIELSWDDKSNNENGFVINRDDGFQDVESENTIMHIDENVNEGSTYSYEVSAFNSIETSSPAKVTIVFDKPNPPTNFSVKVISTTHNRLSWSADNNAEGFKILRAPTGTALFTEIPLSPVSQDNITYTAEDELIPPGETYTYKIIAFNIFGDSDPPDEKSP